MSHYSTLKGLGRAVAYYPAVGLALGNPLAGIMLSQLIYWNDKTENNLGVYKTAEEWTAETGLTYSQQRTARKLLRELGILIETEKRLEHKIFYKLDIPVFDAWYQTHVIKDQIGEMQNPISRNEDLAFGDKQNLNSGSSNHQSVIHKITSEITSENKKIYKKSRSTVDGSEKPQATKFDFKAAIIENGVSEKTATEFMQVRKAKGGVSTERAFTLLVKQIEKAKLTFAQGIEYCLNRQKPWAAFEAEWYFNEQNRTAQQQQTAQPFQRRFGNTQQAPVMRDIVGECQ
ncbi:hypothetical protein [Acinetobacter brisouii]|uniref:hypothetical protein n=1 Tax=Acinetobacter brisouii TaxID=396323 RepID=UPI00124FB999|nr:hypothetical protein [Acinetobacter brisouii]